MNVILLSVNFQNFVILMFVCAKCDHVLFVVMQSVILPNVLAPDMSTHFSTSAYIPVCHHSYG
jgi:hypothetical protein